jgi:hypothetical protein
MKTPHTLLSTGLAIFLLVVLCLYIFQWHNLPDVERLFR